MNIRSYKNKYVLLKDIFNVIKKDIICEITISFLNFCDLQNSFNNIKYLSKHIKENNINLKLMVSCIITKDIEDEEEILKNLLLPLLFRLYV